jgi:hypothetical protein
MESHVFDGVPRSVLLNRVYSGTLQESTVERGNYEEFSCRDDGIETPTDKTVGATVLQCGSKINHTMPGWNPHQQCGVVRKSRRVDAALRILAKKIPFSFWPGSFFSYALV